MVLSSILFFHVFLHDAKGSGENLGFFTNELLVGILGWGEKAIMDGIGTSVSSKASRGIGIKDISNFNKALLGKWRWRIIVEPNNMWARVIRAKYGEFGLRMRYFVMVGHLCGGRMWCML